jgi:hypothetical protein
MIDTCIELDGVDERSPRRALPSQSQDATPLGGQSVEAASPLTSFFDPAAVQPATALERIQQGIERGHWQQLTASLQREETSHFHSSSMQREADEGS